MVGEEVGAALRLHLGLVLHVLAASGGEEERGEAGCHKEPAKGHSWYSILPAEKPPQVLRLPFTALRDAQDDSTLSLSGPLSPDL
jgi:hypothetical protein